MSMVILLSPAKKLNENYKQAFNGAQMPVFLDKARQVNTVIKKLNPKKIAELQDISAALAELNYNRNQNWQTEANYNAYTPALMLFNGDAYEGLDVKTLTKVDLNYAEENLRILSGLYGVLKPSDLIEPYRLEMGTPIKIGKSKNLYDFWKPTLTQYFQENFSGRVILNLASQEYSGAVNLKKLENPVVEAVFKDRNAQGQYKVMSFFAKRARGLMARYVLKKQIEDPIQLINFDYEGYYYSESDSTRDKLVFLRDSKKENI